MYYCQHGAVLSTHDQWLSLHCAGLEDGKEHIESSSDIHNTAEPAPARMSTLDTPGCALCSFALPLEDEVQPQGIEAKRLENTY